MNLDFHGVDLINGNSYEAIRKFSDNQFDWAIIDPPYGINGNSHRNNLSRNKLTLAKRYHNALWDQKIPNTSFFKELFRVSKNQVIFGINYFLSNYNLKVGSGRIFWDKVNGSNNFSDGEIAYISSIVSTRICRYMWNGMMQGKSVKEGHIVQGNKLLNELRIHPTQKPVALYSWILNEFTQKDDLILDTHLGSGSIAIACYNLRRRFVGIEIDPVYFNDALKRYKDHTSQLQLPWQ